MVNLQKLTLNGCELDASITMFAPAQNDALLAAADDDRFHAGVLEAQALDRVRELDVDAEVVAVELELVERAI